VTLLTARDVMAQLRMTRSTFYDHRTALQAAGVLVEALPRVGRTRRYLPGPIAAYVSGETRTRLTRAHVTRQTA
jgi:hypothetical protein